MRLIKFISDKGVSYMFGTGTWSGRGSASAAYAKYAHAHMRIVNAKRRKRGQRTI